MLIRYSYVGIAVVKPPESIQVLKEKPHFLYSLAILQVLWRKFLFFSCPEPVLDMTLPYIVVLTLHVATYMF